MEILKKPFSAKQILFKSVHRGSYLSVHVLLNLLNELRIRDKM